MLAHRLRHRVRIQYPVETQDPVTGEVLTSWSDVELSPGKPDIPAEVLTGAGRELIAAGAKHGETDARINVRWFPYTWNELYKCRIVWQQQYFNVVSVETDVTGRQEYRFKCKAGVSNGH